MFKKLRTVIYYFTDLQASKKWYTNLLGIQPYFDEPFYAGFHINGCELGLNPYDKTYSKGNQTLSHWAVDNIENCLTAMVNIGATPLNKVSDVGGGIKMATIINPWENSVGLIEEL